jgi:dolichol-phosphate mannosyltransferase
VTFPYSKKVLVGIPVFNCELNIRDVLTDLEEHLNNLHVDILVVDNKSSDETFREAKKWASTHSTKIEVQSNFENIGLGGSQTRIFWRAIHGDFDYVAIFHGDGQGIAIDLRTMIEMASAAPSVDAFLGSRFMPSSKLENYSYIRTLGNRVFNSLFSISLRAKVEDLGAGVNLYKVDSLKSLNPYSIPSNLSFNYGLLVQETILRQNLIFVPITWRDHGQISNVRLFSQTLQLLRIWKGSWRAKRPEIFDWENSLEPGKYEY